MYVILTHVIIRLTPTTITAFDVCCQFHLYCRCIRIAMYVADRLKSELSLGIDSSSDLGVHDFQHLTGIPANWSLFVSPPSSPTRNEFEFFTAAYSHILWYPEQIFINTRSHIPYY